MRTLAHSMVGIDPIEVTPRGRVWHALKGLVGQSFTASQVAASFPDIPTFVVHRHIDELTTHGAIARRGRGLFRVAADPSEWPNPAALYKDPARPSPMAYVKREIELHVPTTQDGMWGLIQHLDREGRAISVEVVFAAFGGEISKVAVAMYIGGLARAGYLVLAKGATSDPTWFLAKRQPETPRVGRDGVEPVVPTRQAYVWRAMKMLGYFTISDLILAAETDDVPMPRHSVAAYIEQLAAVGYLMAKGDGDKRVFRLKERMKTGPAAPRILSAQFVWDPNTLRIVGEATRVQEVRR